MHLTNPPCQEVTLWPYPATVSTPLGNATVDAEKDISVQWVTVRHENGAKARDVMRRLEQRRGAVPIGATFRIKLHGVMVRPYEDERLLIDRATDLEQQERLGQQTRNNNVVFYYKLGMHTHLTWQDMWDANHELSEHGREGVEDSYSSE